MFTVSFVLFSQAVCVVDKGNISLVIIFLYCTMIWWRSLHKQQTIMVKDASSATIILSKHFLHSYNPAVLFIFNLCFCPFPKEF